MLIKIFQQILAFLVVIYFFDDIIINTTSKNLTKCEVLSMERMQCDNCGYVYDKDEGDPKNNIPPGTAWADVPADYKCPECGAGKDVFIIE